MTDLFPAHTARFNAPGHCAAAFYRFNYALVAGPYPTEAAAAAVLEHAKTWALTVSGDPRASEYRFDVFRGNTGHYRSILGVVRPGHGGVP